MRIPIFNLDKKTTYKDEYFKMIKILCSKCVSFNNNDYTYFDFVNIHLFNNWKYRETYLDCYEYLEHIGVSLNSKKITEDAFLNFLEFILNIELLIENSKLYYDNTKFSVKCKSVIFHNIPIILDNSGYASYNIDDKIIITKKDIVYDEINDLVPNDIYELLLSYTSVNNNGIKMKKIILNKLFDYLSKDADKYKSYNTSIYNSIKLIVNKMGIVKEIDKKYSNLSNYKLKKYYDDAFYMIVYLINTEEVIKYRDEIKKISKIIVEDNGI